MGTWRPMSLILLKSWRKVKARCWTLHGYRCGTTRMLESLSFATSQTGGDTSSKLCRMKLLWPSESTLRPIFLLFLVNGDLAHLELCWSVDLRRKLMVLWITRLGRVSWTNFNWSPRRSKPLSKNVSRLKRWLILRGICIKCALFWDHSLLMLPWEIVGMINTWSVSHGSWGCSVRLGFGVSQLPWMMLLLIRWLL